MAITVFWSAHEIFVPRAHMTLVQTTPIEIRQLDINAFRLELRSLEDDEAGMPYPSTHAHNTTLSVGGVTLARVINILDPYTVTFEDGAYAVNLVGANSNIADRININNVSVRSANSAGLVQKDEIEIASYSGSLTIDQSNTTGKALSGQAYPAGTYQAPVLGIEDAIFIQNLRGIPKTLEVLGNLTAAAGDTLTDWHLVGATTDNQVTLEAGSLYTNCSYSRLHLAGVTNGITRIHDCELGNLTQLTGEVSGSTLEGTLTVATGFSLKVFASFSSGSAARIDCGGAAGTIEIQDHNGILTISNLASGTVRVGLSTGTVVLDPTCTGGTFRIAGVGSLVNNSTGTSVDSEGLTTQDNYILRVAVESLRTTHHGYGVPLFVDPVRGLSTNDGKSIETPLSTYAEAELAAVDGRNDIIYFINSSSTAVTHFEDIVVSKSNIHIRSTTRDIRFKAASPGGDLITVEGDSCSISGLLLDGDKAGAIPANNCLNIKGKFCLLDTVWAKNAAVDCITIRGGDYHVIHNSEIELGTRHGVSIFDDGLISGPPMEITLSGNTNIYYNGGNGVHVGVSTTPVLGSTTSLIRFVSGEVTRNTGYGLQAEAQVDGIIISDNVIFHSNNGGMEFPQTNILTTEAHNDRSEKMMALTNYILNKDLSGYNILGSVGESLYATWQLLGLDPANPSTTTRTAANAGSVNQVISGDGETTTTVTRQ